MILALDPSSSRTGYAVGDSIRNVIDHGVLVPDRARDRWDRIMQMMVDVRNLTVEYPQLTEIVIEVPDGKVHGRHGKVNMGALSIYGAAVGAMLAECWHWRERGTLGKVLTADVNDWTRSSRKATRIIMAESIYPTYDATKDAGGDMADALCLLCWRLDRSAFNTQLSLAKARTKRKINTRKIVTGIFTGEE